MLKPSLIIGSLIIAITISTLFHVKYRVQELEQELKQVRSQIARENSDIHVLTAEWGYLNKPDRVKLLADKNLAMKPVMAVQIKNLEDIEHFVLKD